MSEINFEQSTSNETLLNDFSTFYCDVSYSVLLTENLVVNYILLPIVGIFSILGNSGTIIILIHNGLNETTNIILTALAVTDMFFSMTQIWNQLLYVVSTVDYRLGLHIYAYYIAIGQGWNQCAVCVSVHMVTLIAVERMIAVCFPFFASSVITPYRIKCIVITIFVCDGICYIPRAFASYIKWGFYSPVNDTIPIAYNSDFSYTNGFNIYLKGFIATVAIVIPTFLIITCTLMIIIRLTISYKSMKKITSLETRNKRIKDVRSIKITLTICVCVVILVLIPTNSLNFTSGDNNLFSSYCAMFIEYLIFLVYQLNASINFIIYVILSPKFANSYKHLFLCSSRNKNP